MKKKKKNSDNTHPKTTMKLYFSIKVRESTYKSFFHFDNNVITKLRRLRVVLNLIFDS